MRSLVLAAALAGALLALPVPAGAVSPLASPGRDEVAAQAEEASTAPPRAQVLARQVARQAAEHRVLLDVLFDQAEQHEQHEQERAERAEALAELGWAGDEVDDAVVVRPVTSYAVSAGYGVTGPRWLSVHSGLDLAGPTGTTLVAAAEATVTSVDVAGAYGLRTVLTLADGTELWYCHQSATLVTPGEVVVIGEPVGLMGSTGNTTGPHLHLEVRPGGGAAIDPVPWFAAHGIIF